MAIPIGVGGLQRGKTYLKPVGSGKKTPGVKVYHPDYGHGTVEGTEESMGRRKALIRFKRDKKVLRRFTISGNGIEGVEILE